MKNRGKSSMPQSFVCALSIVAAGVFAVPLTAGAADAASSTAKTGSNSVKAAPSAPVAKKKPKKIKYPCIKTADGLVCPPELPPPPK